MYKTFSLKVRIILQFLFVVSPFALALLYQTHMESERAAHLSRASRLLAVSDTVKEKYTQFMNGVVDAVDSGRLSSQAVEALKLAKAGLQELRREDPSQNIEQALQHADKTLAVVSKDTRIDALVPIRVSINDLATQIARINQEYNQAIKSAVPSAIEMADQQKQVALAVLVLTVVMTLLFVRFMITGLTRPLRVAESVAQQIASGKIAKTLNVSKGNELGKVLDSLVTMNSSLFNLLGSVKAAAGSVSRSVDAIASGNEDISRRAERQAAFLSAASDCMKTLASAVEQNTASARQADELVTGASKAVQAGDQAMSEVVETMASIRERADKINNIVDLIDDVTHQTNLLAHNATIEAARAGEAGRTFAVVADEVRKLSDRVALAAKNIKALIDDSSERVAIGNRQVERAGATMQQIISGVQKVAAITATINASSAKQRRDIAQLSEAIRTMETMTHENSVVIDRTTAASTELRRQEKTLAAAVSAFHLSDAGGSVAPNTRQSTRPENGKSLNQSRQLSSRSTSRLRV